MKMIIICGGMLVIAATDAQAYVCTTVTANTVLTPPPMTIQRDLPVGSPIGNEILSGQVDSYSCTNKEPRLTWQEFGVKAYGTYVTTINRRRIFSTNIEGVGYAVGATMVSGCSNYIAYVDGLETLDGNLANRNLCSINGMFSTQPIIGIARIQFYKTAATTGSGAVTARNVGSFILRNNQSVWHQPESRINISGFSVTTIACTTNNTIISVPMGTVEKREFNGPGTWPGHDNTRNFSISLNCNAGTRVNLQIDGNTQNATQGVLNLNGGTESASGVGIQLLHNNAPLPLSTVLSMGTAATEGEYQIPLQARYIQTQSTVTPGSANSSATILLTYQ